MSAVTWRFQCRAWPRGWVAVGVVIVVSVVVVVVVSGGNGGVEVL